jgi:hypothetical protein
MSDQIIVMEPDQQPDLAAVRDSIRKLIDEGLTVQVIAARLNLDPSRVLAVSDESRAMQRKGSDNGQKLGSYLGQLDEIIDLAHWQCKAEPIPANVYAYTALVETARGVMQDIDGRRDNTKLTEDLIKKVLEPAVNEIIIAMTQKLASVKIDINNTIPAEHHTAVTGQIEDILRTLGAVLSDQLTSMGGAVGRVLNDSKTEQKPQQQNNRRAPKMIGR